MNLAKISLSLSTPRGGGGVTPAPAVRELLSTIGDSWTRGNEQEISRSSPTVTATDRWTNQLATALGVSENVGDVSGWTTGIINLGSGGATTATINTNHATVVSGEPARAGDIAIIGPGKNNTSTSTGVADVLSGVDAILARLTSDRKIVWRPRGASGVVGTGTAIPSWVRSKRIQWAYREDSRRPYFFELDRYWGGLSPNGSSGTAADDVEAAGEGSSTSNMIATLRASAGADQLHPNYLTAPMWSAAFLPVVQAMQNKAVFVLDETITTPYDIAAGAKIEIYFKGYVTSAAITTDDPTYAGLFTIAMKSGSTSTAELTRTSTSSGNIPAILNLIVTATGVDTAGAAKTHAGNIRIVPSMEGAASTVPRGATFPRDTHATASSRRWPFMASELGQFADGRKISIFIAGLKVGEDSTNMNMLFIGASNRLIVNRTSANKIAFTLTDTGGTTLMAWTSVTSNINIAGGIYNIALSYDYNSGAPVAKMYEWHGGAWTNIAPATGFGAGTANIGLNSPLYLFNGGNGQASFKGSLKAVWMDDRYIDFSSSTERDKFADPTTGLPVDLGTTGTVDSIQPKVYLAGEAGDFMKGLNRGSSYQFGFNDNWLLGFGSNKSDPAAY